MRAVRDRAPGNVARPYRGTARTPTSEGSDARLVPLTASEAAEGDQPNQDDDDSHDDAPEECHQDPDDHEDAAQRDSADASSVSSIRPGVHLLSSVVDLLDATGASDSYPEGADLTPA